MQGADGWLVSNDNVLGLAAHQASLDLFAKAGIENLRRKSQLLTSYLEFAIRETISDTNSLEIITPLKPTDRGCQLSLLIQHKGKRVFDFWIEKDVVADWRNPNVIRLAPTPMYNSFQDVYEFSQILKNSLND